MARNINLKVGSNRIPQPTELFPGDPGEGHYYIGWALGPNGNLTVDAVRNNNPGWPGDDKVSIIHDYAASTSTQFIVTSEMDQAIENGFFPSLSVKGRASNGSTLYGGHTGIVAGDADTALTNTCNYIKAFAPIPIWLCFHHEPENDGWNSTQLANFRAASRYIVEFFRDQGVTNAAFMPIYMNPYTFRSSSSRDWRVYHPDYAGSGNWHTDLTMDLFGADTYAPFPGNTNYETMPGMFNDTYFCPQYPSIPGIKEAPTPEGIWNKGIVIPEFGMSNQMDPNPDWPSWCEESRDFFISDGVKAVFYWDNSSDIGRWSFGTTNYTGQVGTPGHESFDPDGSKKEGWDIIVAAASKWESPL